MSIPATPAADHPALFASEREQLLALLRGLEPSRWSLPTPCPAWDVHGLVVHLAGDDLSLLARQRDGHADSTAPDPAVDEHAFIGWLDRHQLAWVAGARRLSPRLAIDLLAWTGPQVVELFRSQDPTAVVAQVSWASTGPVPVWLDQARELSEHWIHRQQLHDALGLPVDLGEPVARVVLDALRWALPHGLDGVGRPGEVVRIDLTGDIERRWWLRRSATGWAFVDDADDRPALTAVLDADDAWRLLTNNLSAGRQRALDVRGAPELVRAVRRTRAIIGAPQ